MSERTVRIRVRVYGHLVWYLEGERETVDLRLPEGTSADELFRRLGVPAAEVAAVMRNGRRIEPAASLREGDCLELIPVVSGG